jgi:Tfp pilus assembly protein PilO
MNTAARLSTWPLAARRGIVLTLFVAVLLLAWTVIVLPLQTVITSQAEWRESAAQEIARDRGLLKSAAQVREAAMALDKSELHGWLYESGGGLPAVDALQNDLRTALLASGIEPTNFKVLPAASTKGLRVQRVEFSTIVTVDQLQAFFLAVERLPHYVRIERLRLDAPETQRNDENPRMTALMEARGYSVDRQAPEVRVARAY